MAIGPLGWHAPALVANGESPEEGGQPDRLAIVYVSAQPPPAVLVGEVVTMSLSLTMIFAGLPAPLNAVVVWEPPRTDATEAELAWRETVRSYVATAITHDGLGAPRAEAIAGTRGQATVCGRMTVQAEVEDCLRRLDDAGEPDLAAGLEHISPLRLAMRQALTLTLGLREWVVVVGDGIGEGDCEALADQRDPLVEDEVRHVAAICATSRCRQDCMAEFTGSSRRVVAFDSPIDVLGDPRDNSSGIPRRAEAAEIRIAMGEGGRIETTSQATDVDRLSSTAVRWRHGPLPVQGITVSWTARALRAGSIDWLDELAIVVTDTLGGRLDRITRPPERITGLALDPERLGGATRLWLPALRR